VSLPYLDREQERISWLTRSSAGRGITRGMTFLHSSTSQTRLLESP
jgi:hypothetical protein